MSKYGIHNTPKEVMLIVASNVRIIRKKKKMTQKQLSGKSGVAYASIKKFESTGIISFESLLKLCNALDRLYEFEELLQFDINDDKAKLFDI